MPFGAIDKLLHGFQGLQKCRALVRRPLEQQKPNQNIRFDPLFLAFVCASFHVNNREMVPHKLDRIAERIV